MSSVPVMSILRKWKTRLKTGINKVSRISLNELEVCITPRQSTPSRSQMQERTLNLAQSKPKKLKRSANSGKVTCSIKQSIKAGINGSTASPVVPTIRLNAKRACIEQRQSKRRREMEIRPTASRMITNPPIVFATVKIPCVASLNTPTQSPVAIGVLELRSGNPLATFPTAIIR